MGGKKTQKTMEVKEVWFLTFFKIYSFVFQKKEIHSGLEQLEVE